MRMSVISLKFYRRGFTLIEVMVVILIVGLIASVLSPSMQRMANSIQARVEFLEVKREIQSLSSIAMQKGESADLSDLKLLEGWSAAGDVTYQPNGVCLGGNLYISYEEVEFFRQDLEPPFCKIGNSYDR